MSPECRAFHVASGSRADERRSADGRTVHGGLTDPDPDRTVAQVEPAEVRVRSGLERRRGDAEVATNLLGAQADADPASGCAALLAGVLALGRWSGWQRLRFRVGRVCPSREPDRPPDPWASPR